MPCQLYYRTPVYTRTPSAPVSGSKINAFHVIKPGHEMRKCTLAKERWQNLLVDVAYQAAPVCSDQSEKPANEGRKVHSI
jgi:hypothetical protein